MGSVPIFLSPIFLSLICIGFLCVFGLIAFIGSAGDYYINYLNLREELPEKIFEKNIIYGKVEAYLSNTFYKKYRLTFVKSKPIITEKKLISKGTWGAIRDSFQNYYYFYLKNDTAITKEEAVILQSDFAISFLKYKGQDGNIYFFTVTGAGGGSANFSELTVKLYKLKNNDYSLIFKTHETYSTDPGIDSYVCIEHFDMWFLKNIAKDGRY